MVKQAFTDEALNKKLFLTSANSINVARWLPQQFYYFYAYQQWMAVQSTSLVQSAKCKVQSSSFEDESSIFKVQASETEIQNPKSKIQNQESQIPNPVVCV